jgi:hypothetical protein
MKIIRYFVISLLFFVTACGCGNKQVGLSGRVTFSDNGQPLEQGAVLFETEKFSARGFIGKGGYFTMGSYSERDGLPLGTYSIAISGAVDMSKKDKNDMPIETFLIDPKYFDSKTSGITITVDKTTRNCDIQVDRYVPTRKSTRK